MHLRHADNQFGNAAQVQAQVRRCSVQVQRGVRPVLSLVVLCLAQGDVEPRP